MIDPGILALLIPVLALATGFVAVLKMPRESFLPKSKQPAQPDLQALQEEVGQLRAELTAAQERLDFTERLLAGRSSERLPKGQ
jgi:hypothetical protein